MSIRTNRGFLHRHHRHGVNIILVVTFRVHPYRQDILNLLWLRVKRVQIVKLVPEFVMASKGASTALIPEAEAQLAVGVHHVVLIVDLAVLDQLAVEVAALIAHSAGNLHRENTPLC